jgi:hypothetical protein
MRREDSMHRTRRVSLHLAGLCLALALAGVACKQESSSSSPRQALGPSSCAPDAATFEAQIWQPVIANRCTVCHGPGGAGHGSRFSLAAASDPGGMAQNLASAEQVALATEGGVALLLQRPTGHDHPGGMVISAASAEYAALAQFVAQVQGDAAACAAAVKSCQPGDPGPRLVRRLSRTEYDNTLRDLFGVTQSYAPGLVPDVVVKGFDNNAQALVVSPLLAQQLQRAAEAVAAQVAARPAYACSGDGAACAQAFLTGAAARIFRRPLTSDEVTRWLAVYQTGSSTAPSGTPAHQSGMELLLAGMLQSPGFLYRSELGADDGTGRYALSSYEIASELSYFLWAAPPDDALWQAAASGGLRDPAAIAAQARRLLASPRARASLDRFTVQWLGIDQLATVPKDPVTYPQLTDALRADMGEEVDRTFAAVAQGGGTIRDLLIGSSTWVNADLAGFYGLPAPASPDAGGFGLVQGRGGLLATGAVLTVRSRANSSSPVLRGRMVRERLLCQDLPPPPPGVVAQPPPVDPSQTTRQRFEAHRSDPSCASCHHLMDPIGFAFEHYDGIGRFRTTEGGQAIDDTGQVLDSASTDGSFTGIDGLAALLAGSDEVQSCFALQWVRWAYGIQEDAQTACLADDIRARFKASGYVIEDLLVGLTQASQFRFRAGAAAADAGAGGGAGSADPGTGAGAPDGGSPSAPEGSSGGSAPPAGDTPGVTATVTVTNPWQTGYCATLDVKNVSSQPVTWRVTVTIDGTIYDHWNSDVVQSGTSATFNGAAFNGTVAPGATAQAGFCANL